MRRALLVLVVFLGVSAVSSAQAGSPPIQITVFVKTMRMADILWDGTSFYYVVNTKQTLWRAPAAGLPLTLVARMPKIVEETRCVISPGDHGFPAGVFFCHSPSNQIYEIPMKGGPIKVFAKLPVPPTDISDGALAFDSGGRFGFTLVAATGRSGTPSPGGAVFTIGPTGTVHKLTSYTGPGGADEVTIAPSNFGSLAGDALLSVDAGPGKKGGGRVAAVDAQGHVTTVASMPGDGPNPMVPIPSTFPTTGTPTPGVYITDDESRDIYLLPASALQPYAGDIVVLTEVHGRLWVLAPSSSGAHAFQVSDVLPPGTHGIEQATFVG